MTMAHRSDMGKGLLGAAAGRPDPASITVDFPVARGESALLAKAGALLMYAVHMDSRPYRATLGGSAAMLLLSFLLAEADPGNQGPAWLAAIAGSSGVGGGLAIMVFQYVRECRRQTREDSRERQSREWIDRREREFIARMDREYRDHREHITRELADHQKRLDAIITEIDVAREKRHDLRRDVNRELLEMEERLQQQAAEIARLTAIVNGNPEHP